MRGRRQNKHDIIAWNHPADPMDHCATQKPPPKLSLIGYPADRALRHRRIMLQGKRSDPAFRSLVRLVVTHDANKTPEPADVGSPRSQASNLGRDIEIFRLHADRRHRGPWPSFG